MLENVLQGARWKKGRDSTNRVESRGHPLGSAPARDSSTKLRGSVFKLFCVLGGIGFLLPNLLGAPTSAVHLNEILAANVSSTGLKDEDGKVQDWIEIYNSSSSEVSLAGWSLTDDPAQAQKWTFPPIPLAAGQYLIVFASGKDRKPADPRGTLHTNFKLNASGEYIGLFNLAASPTAVSELAPNYPPQQSDVSYGLDEKGNWVYFQSPTPGGLNGSSGLVEVVSPVHFSVKSGLFDSGFVLELSTPTSGAAIRYTTDLSRPADTNGEVYVSALPIQSTTIIRAAGFKTNALPSEVRSRSYLFNTGSAIQSLPIISIVLSPEDLSGPTGIMGISGGMYVPIDRFFSGWTRVNPSDYFNPAKTGMAWERPASVELLERQGEPGFKIECGIRVHGSDSSRLTYRSDFKVPYGLFFRQEYGQGKLNYPLVPDSPVQVYDSLVLRAGHNDAVNPFITDELMRRLFADTGQASSRGTFVNLFLNGNYQGYYNPAERLDEDWARSWFDSTNGWDVITAYSEVQQGDTVEWLALLQYAKSHDPTWVSYYQEMSRRLDLVNFVDYLLVNIYADTHDWTVNNWRAIRERVSDGKFRFVMWDAEQSLGIYGSPVNHNTLSDPAELANSSEISTLFKKLKANREFKLLFADRIEKQLFNGGALSDTNILARFETLRQIVSGVITNMADNIPNYWVPQRRDIVLQQLAQAGFRSTLAAPTLNQHGGVVPAGFNLEMSAPAGRIYYTLNGVDPRVMFSGKVAPEAEIYTQGTPISLQSNLVVKARSLTGTTWSALTQAPFQVGTPAEPDSDGDGIPDAWELAHGLDPHNAADGALDPDGDGVSNLEEFRAGTDPHDQHSYLKIDSISAQRDAITIRFTAAADKSYSVIYRNVGETGSWSKLGDVPIGPTARTVDLTDTITQTNSARFYRVVTPLSPSPIGAQ